MSEQGPATAWADASSIALGLSGQAFPNHKVVAQTLDPGRIQWPASAKSVAILQPDHPERDP
eukprot:6461115-Amphidinium_carterae.1